jgi:hypothetical protein
MRSFFFSLAYSILSAFYALVADLASIVAGAAVVRAIMRRQAPAMAPQTA